MAAADDRSELSVARASDRHPRPSGAGHDEGGAAASPELSTQGAERSSFSWLGLIGIGLVLALVISALVQIRQFWLSRDSTTSGDEFAIALVHQAEAEYLRLREAWWRALHEEPPPDPAALRLRYEIWVSRVDLLHAGRAQALLATVPGAPASVQALRRFIGEADAALGAQPKETAERAFLERLWPRLQALAEPLRGMTVESTHRIADAAERRRVAAQTQNLLGLGLTLFLSLLTLLFALVAFRHLRHLRERRRVLEGLAANLRQARRDAEAASEAKSVFLANISHEIRTPFHGLMGMLSLLREAQLTLRQREYLRTATESADHLLAILNDVLDLSQLESGRLSLKPAPLDPRVLLHDVEALMRPQARAKGLALHFAADPAVPERLLADATRVKQVLFNLLSNAIKFSSHGSVTLELQVRGPHHDRPELAFIVTDTGVGMDEATQAQLFKRFQQGDNSRSRRHGGTGLGLEISRNLAQLMGGDIDVYSKPGIGSRFTFRMPLVAAPAAEPEPAAATRTGAPRRTLEVLVAEDHPTNREYLAALLESLGHRCSFVHDGEQAVQAVRERGFDVVLMDLHMPVLDGVAATGAIRALPERAAATVPIVALTADALPETRDRCLVAGMNDFLTKPVSPQDLAAALRRLFGAQAVTPGAERAAPTPAAPPEDPTAIVDEQAVAMALKAMPRERLAALIEEFLGQGPETVERLRVAVRDGQPLELKVNAHAVKGAALNLGLTALAATAEALHEGAAHLPAHEVARLVQRYEELLPITRAAVIRLGLLGAASATR